MLKIGLRVYFLLMFAASVYGQLSPGELHKSHAALEGLKNCTQCHSVAAQTSPVKCLDCHSVLKERIDKKRGLHARADHKECGTCHGEHYGRNVELIRWKDGEENFDHRLAGYKLEGAHAETECRDCHNAESIPDKGPLIKAGKDLNRTFLGLSQECNSCHADEHRGQLSQKCQTCHSMDIWKPVRGFDHQVTRFPLTGRHKTVQCQECHKTITDNRAPDDPTYLKMNRIAFSQCSDCHTDPHQGRFEQTCASCHNTSGWNSVAIADFDHDKTRYPLRGKHVKVQCESCHKPGKPYRGLAFRRCMDCHSDFHQRQFARRPSRGACEECHTVDGYSPSKFTLKEHQTTDFKLQGAHLAVACVDCHSGTPQSGRSAARGRMIQVNRFVMKSSTCQDCHGDPHFGEVNKFLKADGCLYCHNINSWEKITFNHSQTGFDLKGQHSRAECSSCHKPTGSGTKRARINFANMSMVCQDCHRDVHQGQFMTMQRVKGNLDKVTDCSRCHNSEDWSQTNFNHDRDSKFKLEGLHSTVSCKHCHISRERDNIKFTVYKPLSTKCSACHGGA